MSGEVSNTKYNRRNHNTAQWKHKTEIDFHKLKHDKTGVHERVMCCLYNINECVCWMSALCVCVCGIITLLWWMITDRTGCALRNTHWHTETLVCSSTHWQHICLIDGKSSSNILTLTSMLIAFLRFRGSLPADTQRFSTELVLGKQSGGTVIFYYLCFNCVPEAVISLITCPADFRLFFAFKNVIFSGKPQLFSMKYLL